MAEKSSVSRREFIKAASATGAGLVIGFYLPSRNQLLASGTIENSFVPNIWVTVQPDDQIIITSGKSEMGQGVWTSLPMIIAEEMDADWSKVKIEQGIGTKETAGRYGTGGSRSVRDSWTKLRRAGATAREMLLSAAAHEWNIEKSECTVENSIVRHPATSRQMTFGQLTVAASKERVPKKVTLKDPSNFKLIGTDIPRKDTPLKVTGAAGFAMDINLDGMVIAMVVRPPRFGATVKKIDSKQAEKTNGILDIFEVSNGVAVVGSNTWAVLQARKVLNVSWSKGE